MAGQCNHSKDGQHPDQSKKQACKVYADMRTGGRNGFIYFLYFTHGGIIPDLRAW